MWQIYADDQLLADTRLCSDEAKAYRLAEIEIRQAVNKVGSMQFTIYPDHPHYGSIQRLKTRISAYADGKLYFYGRVISDSMGFYNERTVQCESILAVLLDSVQRPFIFPEDDEKASPSDYLEFLLSRHNEQMTADKQIILGTVTVTDPNNYILRQDTEYSTTWELIQTGLLDTLGGYLQLRVEEDGRYLDYLEDFTTLANQPIKLGLNLRTLETERTGEAVATAILPLGAEDADGNVLTLASLPDEESDDICKAGDLVYSKEAEALYGGRIVQVATFEEVTLVGNLLLRAKKKLAAARQMQKTITLTAADISMAAANGADYRTFSVGTYVQITDAAHESGHELETRYLIQEVTCNPLNPASTVLTLSQTTSFYTERQQSVQKAEKKKIQSDITRMEAAALKEMTRRQESAIESSAAALRSYVADAYYLKSETDTLVSNVSTQVTQTANGIYLQFDTLQKDLQEVAAGTDIKFSGISRYIRLEDGTITLGEAGNPLCVCIQNDRISFQSNGLEVAYLSDQKLYITDGTFLNSLQLGNFIFRPRTNGNLALQRI